MRCTRDLRIVRVSIRLLLVSTILSAATYGQSKGSIPEDLRPSLKSRLALFTQAQAEGRWDLVASMLGRYRNGSRSNPYTEAHKECLISQMQAFPMTSLTVKDYRFSTEILSAPLSRRWWYLVGDAVFKTQSGEQKQSAEIVAYRDNGDWFFTPPNYDEYWEGTHLTDADFAADYSNEIEIQPDATSPLEILDLRASIDRKYPSIRRLTFKLRNRSSKKVSGFDLRLFSDGGSVQYGSGCDMEPGASRDEKMDSSRYVYFCNGIKKDKFVVDSVQFADGSEWQRPTRTRSRSGAGKVAHSPQK
jgi:hypothetical protein